MRFFWEMGEGDRENEATKEKVVLEKWYFFSQRLECSRYTNMSKLYMNKHLCVLCFTKIFIGLAYQGKDIVFSFIIEYSSLRDFGP